MLESLGVIRRHLRNLHTNCGTISNVMFIELVPDVLKALTFPDAEGLYKNVDTSIQKEKEVSIIVRQILCVYVLHIICTYNS